MEAEHLLDASTYDYAFLLTLCNFALILLLTHTAILGSIAATRRQQRDHHIWTILVSLFGILHKALETATYTERDHLTRMRLSSATVAFRIPFHIMFYSHLLQVATTFPPFKGRTTLYWIMLSLFALQAITTIPYVVTLRVFPKLAVFVPTSVMQIVSDMLWIAMQIPLTVLYSIPLVRMWNVGQKHPRQTAGSWPDKATGDNPIDKECDKRAVWASDGRVPEPCKPSVAFFNSELRRADEESCYGTGSTLAAEMERSPWMETGTRSSLSLTTPIVLEADQMLVGRADALPQVGAQEVDVPEPQQSPNSSSWIVLRSPSLKTRITHFMTKPWPSHPDYMKRRLLRYSGLTILHQLALLGAPLSWFILHERSWSYIIHAVTLFPVVTAFAVTETVDVYELRKARQRVGKPAEIEEGKWAQVHRGGRSDGPHTSVELCKPT